MKKRWFFLMLVILITIAAVLVFHYGQSGQTDKKMFDGVNSPDFAKLTATPEAKSLTDLMHRLVTKKEVNFYQGANKNFYLAAVSNIREGPEEDLDSRFFISADGVHFAQMVEHYYSATFANSKVEDVLFPLGELWLLFDENNEIKDVAFQSPVLCDQPQTASLNHIGQKPPMENSCFIPYPNKRVAKRLLKTADDSLFIVITDMQYRSISHVSHGRDKAFVGSKDTLMEAKIALGWQHSTCNGIVYVIEQVGALHLPCGNHPYHSDEGVNRLDSTKEKNLLAGIKPGVLELQEIDLAASALVVEENAVKIASVVCK